MLAAHADALQRGPSNDASWKRLSGALAAVCQQKDCYASHLYWYTDMNQAQAAARASGKPILSLRLLGKLNEEFSCANSRFFRTVLYADANVSDYLRERFILHWQSVRPVPRVTVDFGDGRVLERTITGNSIHYVLDAEGRPIDALPGLYGPKAFLQGLRQAEEAALASSKLTGTPRTAFLRRYHQDRLTAIATAWADDLSRVEPAATARTLTLDTLEIANTSSTQEIAVKPVKAQDAAEVAITKSVVEGPLLDAIARRAPSVDFATLEGKSTESIWARIAALHGDDAQLDDGSRRLIMAKNPDAIVASRQTMSKAAAENPLLRTIRNLEHSVALDTVRNEYLLHRVIHQWLIDQQPPSVNALNERVYAQLFLTPSSDPWLGLVPPDTYSALEDEGRLTNR